MMFGVGKAKVDSALELELTGRPIAWLGAAPALIEANRWWMEPHFLQDGDTWSLNFRSWIVRVDDKVIVVDPCGLTPSLRIEPGRGHTDGHSILRLSSDGEEAIFSGDAFHHPLQLIGPSINSAIMTIGMR